MFPVHRRNLLKTVAVSLPALMAQPAEGRVTRAGHVRGVLTGARALVEALQSEGVECVYGIPGAQANEFWDTMKQRGLPYMLCTHEFAAATMADGYARVSGKPGVAFVITGPGLTNALTAMAQARADSVPILVISGVNRRASLGKGLGLLHELPDQAGMVRALCPSFQVDCPEALNDVLKRAFAALTTGRPGPVHIEIPTDVMPLPCPQPEAPATEDPATLPDLTAAVLRLSNAQRPVILAGGGACRADAALRALAERLDAPVVQTVNARGLMHGHPLTVPASPSLNAVRALIAASDQVLAVGTEFGPTDYDMYVRGGLPDLSGMIRIDLCAAQLARHPAALTLQADAGKVMSALLPQLAAKTAQGASRAAAASPAPNFATNASGASCPPNGIRSSDVASTVHSPLAPNPSNRYDVATRSPNCPFRSRPHTIRFTFAFAGSTTSTHAFPAVSAIQLLSFPLCPSIKCSSL